MAFLFLRLCNFCAINYDLVLTRYLRNLIYVFSLPSLHVRMYTRVNLQCVVEMFQHQFKSGTLQATWPILEWDMIITKYFTTYARICGYAGLLCQKIKRLDCCLNKCVVFFEVLSRKKIENITTRTYTFSHTHHHSKENAHLDVCPEPGCREPRYDEDGNPRCVFQYFSIRDQLYAMLELPDVAKYFKYVAINLIHMNFVLFIIYI